VYGRHLFLQGIIDLGGKGLKGLNASSALKRDARRGRTHQPVPGEGAEPRETRGRNFHFELGAAAAVAANVSHGDVRCVQRCAQLSFELCCCRHARVTAGLLPVKETLARCRLPARRKLPSNQELLQLRSVLSKRSAPTASNQAEHQSSGTRSSAPRVCACLGPVLFNPGRWPQRSMARPAPGRWARVWFPW